MSAHDDQEDSRFVEECFHTLGDLQVFRAVIPGPAGEPMEEFLRLGMQAELTFPHVRIAHGTVIEEKELAVSGLGGVLAEQPVTGIDHYLRPTAEYFLRSLRIFAWCAEAAPAEAPNGLAEPWSSTPAASRTVGPPGSIGSAPSRIG